MNYDIPVRVLKLRKHQKDIIIKLRESGINVTQSEFSRYINGVESPPKADLVLSEADKIVSGWEHDARRNCSTAKGNA